MSRWYFLGCMIALITGVIFFAWSNPVAWYFENRFYCSIEWNTVTVTIEDWSTYCFGYIEKIATRIAWLDQDIETAQEYIDEWTDRVYRYNLQSDFLVEKQQLERSRQQIIKAMDDFEKELFLRIKTLISFYLKPEWEEIEQKLDQADILKTHLTNQWNAEQYHKVVIKRNELYREWLLLDAIKQAQTFETLLFPLKTYLAENPEL